MEEQILQHTSLKVLYFYRPDVTAVRMRLLSRSLFRFMLFISKLIMKVDSTGISTYNVWT